MEPENEAEVREVLIDAFESVKEAVSRAEGRSRAGLMLGLQELGASPGGFIGAYYPVYSNLIVVNKTPLRRITETKPYLLEPYSFHILLHEYIHSLGLFDEGLTRLKTYEISRKTFGDGHLATELSADLGKFLPDLVYPNYGWVPETQTGIEIIRGFDKSSTGSYIA